jgi:hypothetical protein
MFIITAMEIATAVLILTAKREADSFLYIILLLLSVQGLGATSPLRALHNIIIT